METVVSDLKPTSNKARANAVGEKSDNAHFTALDTSMRTRGMAMVPSIVVTKDAKKPALLAFVKNGVSIKDIVMMLKLYK